jgi:hypothetical protein
MMMKICTYSIFVVILIASFVFSTARWAHVDPKVDEILRSPGIVERYNQAKMNGTTEHEVEVPPLIRQAKIFALYLNPPQTRREIVAQRPIIGPTRLSPKFLLKGTCYYPSQPEKSMALVWEPGGGGNSYQWVKAGTKLGHFLIEEIKRGAIVYRNGGRVGKMLVEREPTQASIVKHQSTNLKEMPSDAHMSRVTETGVRIMLDDFPSVKPVAANRPLQPTMEDENIVIQEDFSERSRGP